MNLIARGLHETGQKALCEAVHDERRGSVSRNVPCERLPGERLVEGENHEGIRQALKRTWTSSSTVREYQADIP